MSECTNCWEDPCLCGKAGYLVLYHSDIEAHVCSIRHLLALDSEEQDVYAALLGSWVLEKLLDQEELDV